MGYYRLELSVNYILMFTYRDDDVFLPLLCEDAVPDDLLLPTLPPLDRDDANSGEANMILNRTYTIVSY